VAEELKLETFKPEAVNTPAFCDRLAALKADLFAVVAFGTILSSALLRVPRLGCINLHASLLPDYRGPSPIQRALWDGQTGTGVTTMWMDEGIDRGDCLLQRWVGIETSDSAGTLGVRLAAVGAPVLVESLLLAHVGSAPRRPQRGRGSYAPKLAKREGCVDWALDAVTVWNRQRAVTPWPGAVTATRSRRLLLMQTRPHHRLEVASPPGSVMGVTAEGMAVACAPGALLLTRVKPEGRNEMDAGEWARGARIEVGETLQIEKEAHA
jgi:methionyl-tRNA formyltransferase